MGGWRHVANYGLYFYAVVVSGVLLFINGKSRVLFMLLPVLVAVILTAILQATFKRPRPKETKTSYKPFVPTYSFPSMHAAVSFAFASSLSVAFLDSWLVHPILYAAVFFFVAICVAISRVIVGVHYAFDTLAGAVLGVVVSIVLLGT